MNKIYFLGLVSLFFCSINLNAQSIIYTGDFLQGTDINTFAAPLEYQDPLCLSCGGTCAPNCFTGFSTCDYRTFVELSVDPLTPQDAQTNYIAGQDYTIQVTYTFDPANGNPVQNRVLEVTFNTEGNVLTNRAVHFYGAHVDYNITITQVVGPGLLPIPMSATLRVGAEITRYRELGLIGTPPDPNSLNISSSNGEIEFQIMNQINNAVSYDIEWTWIDSELDTDLGNDISFDFKHNSTRINTVNTNYAISDIYRSGYIVARYRGVGYLDSDGNPDCENLHYTEWSHIENGDVLLDVIPSLEISNPGQHNQHMNWQHSRSYAEEGKFKDVINYFDGSLRNRQTVTKLESEDHAIFAETVYDHVGRPAIQILPSPSPQIDNPLAYVDKIDFLPGLNDDYNWMDFELGTNCELTINALHESLGAGNYYSDENDVDPNSLQDFIPDASGYPFSQTVYTQDGTGRISNQGGVGPDHQVGLVHIPGKINHHTKYYYAVPAQEELDRLFGSEIGYSTYYHKNMVVDPNGQVAVSYLDNKERVIATALSGTSPDMVESLETVSPVTINNDLSDSNRPILTDGNISYNIDGQLAISSDNTPVQLDYSFNRLNFSDACAPDLCLDCEYELVLAVTNNECSEVELGTNTPVLVGETMPLYLEAPITVNTDDDPIECTTPNPNEFLTSLSNGDLDIGTYSINKLLSLNEEAMNVYEALYVQHYELNECKTTLVEIFHNLLVETDFEGCYADGICVDNCISNVPFDSGMDLNEYQNTLLECMSMCGETTEENLDACEILYLGMLEDVKPNGMYGTLVRDGNNIIKDDNITGDEAPCLSIYYDNTGISEFGFYRDLVFEDENNDPITVSYNGEELSPTDLPLSVFVDQFDDEWATILVQLHPEYPVYQWCNSPSVKPIFEFEQELLSIETFEDADMLGYMDPLSCGQQNIGSITINSPVNILDQDLFNLYTNLMCMDIMTCTFETESMGNVDFTIWEMAYMVSVGGAFDVAAMIDASEDIFGDPNLMILCNEEKFWELFRALYIQKVRNTVLAENIPTNALLELIGMESVDCPEAEGKMRRMQLISENFDLDFYEADPNDPYAEVEGVEELDTHCTDICASYRTGWEQALQGCLGSGFSNDDLQELLNALEEICVEGCNVDHMLGSSTLGDGESVEITSGLFAGTYQSFAEVFDVVGITATCNDQLLNAPPPHDTDIFAGQTIFIEECNCDEYSQIYAEYESALDPGLEGTVDGFFDYLVNVYEVEFPIEHILDIHCVCNSDSPYLLENPVSTYIIPDLFTCQSCVDCQEIGLTIEEFQASAYGSGLYDLSNSELLEDKGFRDVFTNWMNESLSFNLSFIEYFDFLTYCGHSIFTPPLPKAELNRAKLFLPNTKLRNRVKRTENKSNSVVDLEFTNVYFSTPSSAAGETITYHVEFTATSTSGVQVLDYTFMAPEGWTVLEYPTETHGGTLEPIVDPSNFTVSGIPFDVMNPLSVTWEFDVQVAGEIMYDASYCAISSLFSPLVQIDEMKQGHSTDYYVEEEACLYVMSSQPGPCSDTTDEPEDMIAFLNEIWPDYLDMYDSNSPCSNNIPLGGTSFINSSLNLWQSVDASNLFLQICHDQETDELIFNILNLCDNVLYCEFVIQDIDDVNNIVVFEDISEAIDYAFEPGFQLQIDYLDAQYNASTATQASSTCYCLVPCDRKTLCNRSVAVPIDLPENECTNSTFDVLTMHSQEIYETEINLARERFRKEYVLQCMDKDALDEELNIQYDNVEHHYTLYYYDQSGTLVKTVPPNGVTPLEGTALANVHIDRLDTNTDNPTFPNHNFLTKYNYNSFGTIDHQESPDTDGMNYWYDFLGRPVLSQDGRQMGLGLMDEHGTPLYSYSYTLYDEQGRIIEVGELHNSMDVTDNTWADENSIDDIALFESWISGSHSKSHVIQTVYDINYVYDYDFNGSLVPDISIDEHFGNGYERRYLRKRISSSLFYEHMNPPYSDMTGNGNNELNAYDYATHYDYDIHGNVKTLLQEFRSLEYIDQDIKRIDYEYDLISGNVHKVKYQEGEFDQFFHRYEYDADNRITEVYTSRDNFIWDRDAGYEYYDHGPLARTEVGEYMVQGCDHVYSIHGWIKGVNSSSLSEKNDPSHDGWGGNINNINVGNDSYAYNLNYYGGDYTAIRSTDQLEPAFVGGVGELDETTGLFNGNIKRMNTSIRDLTNAPLRLNPSEYSYDQLHRITEMIKYGDVDLDLFTWNNNTTDLYKTTYSYDANGNLDDLTRFDGVQSQIDDLHYEYYPGTNRLRRIVDNEGAPHQGLNDIGNQANVNNYIYDGSGNLISDASENIVIDPSQNSTGITWDHYGKIRTISRLPNQQTSDVDYHYDAMGNRVVKVERPFDAQGNSDNEDTWIYTFYVRDASGNVMAVYHAEHDGDPRRIEILNEREIHLYGSSRLGIKHSANPDENLQGNLILDETETFRLGGSRNYELSNHLGNVLTTVSDNKLLRRTGPGSPLYKPEQISYSDYYPFGWGLPGRSGGEDHRYGFNGKEKDDEVKGSGVQYDYGFRIYDGRIGKFLSVDPLTKSYPMLTPYQFASNRPIDGIDLDGLEYLDADVGFDYEYGPNPHLSVQNSDGTYNLTLQGGHSVENVSIVTVAGRNYYDIGRHIYNNSGVYSNNGSRSEQVTHNTRVGVQLGSNLTNLPDAPIGYSAPGWNTTDASEIALSQRQANQYDNCEGVCYATTESRAQQAYIDVSGAGVVDLTVSGRNIDHRIAATYGTDDPFMGYGAGGPFARRGYGETVNNTEVWNGDLQQGALLQRWNTTDQTDLYSSGGHSVIFLDYSYDNNGNITGINYTDYHGGESHWARTTNENNFTILGVNLIDRN